MCFSDFVSDPELRNNLGYAYIGVIFFNIATHLLILIFNNIITAKLSIRKSIHKCRSKRARNKIRQVPIEE